ncbi:MAG: CinA family nicotinamide mononucleotide deamidase-related protein [Chloroflexi bacterium]|nr:CinA family nicotinamide mononucleotide deamidase-related protein [Chloroflexota bacterium]
MRAETISIGTELLLGEITDTNAVWIAERLAEVGVDLYFRTTVGDNVGRIVDAIRHALTRADVIITTGGLGPTVDDMTREAVARATNRDLVLDEGLLAQIRERFGKWGTPMSENNVRQAYIPRGAVPIENPVGTAPCFIVDVQDPALAGGSSDHYVISLPGVPREMKYLMETRILPWLREKTGDERIILSKTLRTCAIGESLVDARLADLETSTNPTVGLLAHPGQTDVRVTAKGKTRAEAESMIREMEAKVRERLGDWIYGEADETVDEVVARLLAAQNWRLAVAETNTGGKIAERLRARPEGARIIRAAMLLDNVTELSEQNAATIAQQYRNVTGADISLVILGTTQSGQDMYGEDTGKSAMAVATADQTLQRSYTIGGIAEQGQAWVVIRALDLVRRAMLKAEGGRMKDEG